MDGTVKAKIKIFVVALLSLLIIITLIITSCTAQPDEVIKLRFASAATPGDSMYQYEEQLLDMYEAETGGRIQFERFYGGSLGNDRELMPLVREGAVDAVTSIVVFFNKPEELPIHECLQTPLWQDFGEAMRGNNQIQFDIPETSTILLDEANKYGVQPLVWAFVTGYGMVTTFPVNNLEDIQGKKFNAYGLYDVVKFKRLGINSAQVLPMELYESLSRNLIDGANSALVTLKSQKLEEIGVTFINTQEALCSGFTCMNIDKWNSLPPDIQDSLNRVRAEYIPWAIDFTADDVSAITENFRTAGLQVYELSPAEIALISELQDEVAQELVLMKTEQGLGSNVEAWYQAWQSLR